MLNMRSGDDRSTTARIRDAAIECFAERGVDATSVRAIAERAEVSPGLVIHHFGSKDELRVACDSHIAAVMRQRKTEGMSAGLGFDVAASMRAAQGGPPVLPYLARTLTDGTPQVAALVREMVEDAAAYTETGVETGLLKPSDDPYGRAAVMTIWSFGALVLHEHVKELLGVDLLADPTTLDPVGAAPYVLPIVELLTEGFITEAAADRIRAAFVAGQSQAGTTHPQTPHSAAEEATDGV